MTPVPLYELTHATTQRIILFALNHITGSKVKLRSVSSRSAEIHEHQIWKSLHEEKLHEGTTLFLRKPSHPVTYLQAVGRLQTSLHMRVITERLACFIQRFFQTSQAGDNRFQTITCQPHQTHLWCLKRRAADLDSFDVSLYS